MSYGMSLWAAEGFQRPVSEVGPGGRGWGDPSLFGRSPRRTVMQMAFRTGQIV